VRTLSPQPTAVHPVDGHAIDDDPEAQESTPLLRRETSEQEPPGGRRTRSWWTIISIIILLVITVNIIVFVFLVPSAAEGYASQATSYTLGNIQIEDYTDDGMIAKAQVNVTIDSSRVMSNGVRNLGVFASSIFKHVYTKPCVVSILLPQYNGAQVALATLPALALDIRNRHLNILNITSNVTITNESVAIQLIGDYLAGRRQQIQTIGETDIHIKAGIIPLGTHHMRQEVTVQGR
jgi:hypothetical protein